MLDISYWTRRCISPNPYSHLSSRSDNDAAHWFGLSPGETCPLVPVAAALSAGEAEELQTAAMSTALLQRPAVLPRDCCSPAGRHVFHRTYQSICPFRSNITAI